MTRLHRIASRVARRFAALRVTAGATTFDVFVKIPDPQRAFEKARADAYQEALDQAIEDAEDDYDDDFYDDEDEDDYSGGHGGGYRGRRETDVGSLEISYTGSIWEKRSFEVRLKTPMTLKQAEKFARQDIHHNEKSDPDAFAIPVGKGGKTPKIEGWYFYGWAAD